MTTPIVFTIPELFGFVLAVCGGITCIAAAVAVVANAINKMRAPNRAQDVRLDEHEQWLKKHDAMLDNDNKRLKQLEDGNKIIQRALLELLKHGIDGNDVDGMRKVRDDLQQYLIDR